MQALKPLQIGVAGGEMCCNRVMFKQFLKNDAIQFCQIDSCRIGSINEILAVYLMAKKFNGRRIYFLQILSVTILFKNYILLNNAQYNNLIFSFENMSYLIFLLITFSTSMSTRWRSRSL